MAELTVRGSFVWHELMTTDIAAAVKYYQQAIGWKTQPFEHDPSYLMWVAKSGPLGGVMQLAAGAVPYWLPYVGTPDIEATVNSATKLGGTVVVPVTNLPHGGRYAVLTDPQGANFGVYWSPNGAPAGKPQLGEFGWHELATTDYQAAFAFYQALFGWQKTGEHDMGEMGVYFMFGLNGEAVGGMFTITPNMPMPAAWCSYVRVTDARKTAKVAAKAGGRVINGPMQVPGGSWITQFTDPQGALHAVVSYDPMVGIAPAAGSEAAAAPTAPAKKAAKKKSSQKKTIKKKAAKKKSVKKSSKKATKKTGKKKAVKKVVSKATPKKKVAKKKMAKKKAPKKKIVAKKSKRPAKTKIAKKKSAKRKK